MDSEVLGRGLCSQAFPDPGLEVPLIAEENARQEAPAPRWNDEGDRPPGATVLAALEVVSDIAAVFCLLLGEGLGPDPPLSAVLRFRDTASG